MDWLAQYWPYLLAVLLLGLLAVRLVTMLPRFRQPARHTGERTIRVIGVGGAGGNAVNHMVRAKQRGVDYVAVNTDLQVLEESLATRRIQIGEQLTNGLGAGGDAAIGREAAEEDATEIGRVVSGTDLLFIAAGLGGGTGSGAAPVIAAKAREAGALTVGVVTKPFSFEGAGRRRVADIAEEELKANVDTLLLIENDRVLELIGEDTSMLDAFTVVNEVLARTVRAIADVMLVPGLINLDFGDVRAVMQNGGTATAGIGWASGPDRAVDAARGAVTNPLLDHDIAGAGAILLNVAGASNMTMREVTRAADEIRAAADPEATIIFGTIFDDHLGDELRVTVIATRFSDRKNETRRPAEAVAMPTAAMSTAAMAVAAPAASNGAEPAPSAVVAAPVPAAETLPVAATAPFESPPFESAQPDGPLPSEEDAPVALAAESEEAPEPVGFHVTADDEPAQLRPWLSTPAGGHYEAPEPSDSPEAEAPSAASVATVVATLEHDPASAPPFDVPEAPSPIDEPAQSPSPAMPPSLASILRDEPVPSEEAAVPDATTSPTRATSAPQPSAASQRPDAARQPTSALVGRFWSRIGKSRR